MWHIVKQDIQGVNQFDCQKYVFHYPPVLSQTDALLTIWSLLTIFQ